MEKFLTKKDVLKMLGISMDTLNRWLREKKISGYKFAEGTSRVKFKLSEIEAFIESRKI